MYFFENFGKKLSLNNTKWLNEFKEINFNLNANLSNLKIENEKLF